MSLPFDPRQLEPGDTLLYRPAPFRWRSPFGWLFGKLIAIKTWHNLSHVEVYAGNGVWKQALREIPDTNGRTGHPMISGRASYASRDGLGVDVYPFRGTELAYVLRPHVVAEAGERFDLAAGAKWFATVQGQKYDWLGLARFGNLHPQSLSKMFCSAFWLRFYRACGFNPFHVRIDANSIAPGEILDSPKLTVVWSDGKDDSFIDASAAPAFALTTAGLGLLKGSL